MMNEQVDETGILSGFAPDERQAFLQFAQARDFRKGEVVLAADQHNASLFIVTSGVLQASLVVAGGEKVLATIEPGNFFGEVSVFDPGVTSASVVAVESGSLLEIERESLLRFVEGHLKPGAALLIRLLEEIASRVRRTDERLGDAILLNRPLISRLSSRF